MGDGDVDGPDTDPNNPPNGSVNAPDTDAEAGGASNVQPVELSEEIKKLSEVNITDSGETVLGHFPGYIDKANSKGASYFDIGDVWDDLTPGQRWAANTNFLDRIAEKGDAVNLSLPKAQIKPGSYLANEIEYLTKNKGYRWINQWTLKPPPGN